MTYLVVYRFVTRVHENVSIWFFFSTRSFYLQNTKCIDMVSRNEMFIAGG